jgi:hypothetical protein
MHDPFGARLDQPDELITATIHRRHPAFDHRRQHRDRRRGGCRGQRHTALLQAIERALDRLAHFFVGRVVLQTLQRGDAARVGDGAETMRNRRIALG